MLRKIQSGKHLTSEIAALESQLYSSYKTMGNNGLLTDRERSAYQYAIKKIVGQLWGLSAYLFKNASIEDVRVYKSDEELPRLYKQYVNISRNLSDFVVLDILSCKKFNLAILGAERWLRIAKDCYEKNDFFSASAIVCGLVSYRLAGLALDDNLESLSQDVFKYLQRIFSKQESLYILATRKFENQYEVIPTLSMFASKRERLKNESAQDAGEKELSQSAFAMQVRLTDLEQIPALQLAFFFDVESLDLDKVKPKFKKIKLNTFIQKLLQQLKLYSFRDTLYREYVNFFELKGKVSSLENEAKIRGVHQQWADLYIMVNNIETTRQEKLEQLSQFSDDFVSEDNPVATVIMELKNCLANMLRMQRVEHFVPRRNFYSNNSSYLHRQTSLPPKLRIADEDRQVDELRAASSVPTLSKK